ncbi:MAG: hypothetical protein JXX28_00955 [Deltaproteobacteria bacterium]|nr:hypothetical protein [Deltaproteobacteria bacterium]
MNGALAWVVVAARGDGVRRASVIQADPRSTLLAQVIPVGPTPVTIRERWNAAAVSLHLPLQHRAEAVRAALLEGLHVVVHGPIAPSRQEAEALFSLAESQRRVLHVAHLGVLEAPIRALRAQVSWRSIDRVQANMDLNGPMVMGTALAMEVVPLLQRVFYFAGRVAQIEDIRTSPGALDVELRLRQGGSVSLQLRQAPDFAPWLRLEVIDQRYSWRQEGDSLYRNASPQTLLLSSSTVQEDHHLAMGEILDGAKPHVPHGASLHALELAERIARGTLGPL